MSRATIVFLLVPLLLAGCAGGGGGGTTGGASRTTPPGSYTVPAPAPDPTTADGVAVLALTQIYSWRPADERPGGSLLRARRWLGPHLRAVLDSPAIGVETVNPSLQWSDWASKRAIIEAVAFASGEQAPAATTTGAASATAEPRPQRVSTKIGIEQTVVYPDGRREKLPPTTVIAGIVRTPDGWLLDDYR